MGNPTTYVNITTTVTFSGNVEVCIDYTSLTISGNENIDITSSLDTASDIIFGITTSFSDFAVMTAPTLSDLIARVQEMNLQQGIENSLDAKLQADQDALTAENGGLHATAVSKLDAFINEVEAQRGNKLTSAQADALHSFTTNLIKLIQGITQILVCN